MEDKTLTCVECKRDFTWTAGEQQFYEAQRFTPPKRCRSCRQAMKAKKAAGSRY